MKGKCRRVKEAEMVDWGFAIADPRRVRGRLQIANALKRPSSHVAFVTFASGLYPRCNQLVNPL